MTFPWETWPVPSSCWEKTHSILSASSPASLWGGFVKKRFSVVVGLFFIHLSAPQNTPGNQGHASSSAYGLKKSCNESHQILLPFTSALHSAQGSASPRRSGAGRDLRWSPSPAPARGRDNLARTCSWSEKDGARACLRSLTEEAEGEFQIPKERLSRGCG